MRDDGVITFVVTQQPTNNNWHRNGRRGRNDIKTRKSVFVFDAADAFNFRLFFLVGGAGTDRLESRLCENVSAGDNDRNHKSVVNGQISIAEMIFPADCLYTTLWIPGDT